MLASVECKHGAGPLFRDHARVDYSKPDESSEKAANAGEDKKADPELEGGDGVEADADEVATAISFTPCSPSVVAERLKKDVESRGVWPVLASQAGCPVLEGLSGASIGGWSRNSSIARALCKKRSHKF